MSVVMLAFIEKKDFLELLENFPAEKVRKI